jgi:predicted lipase
MFNKLNRKAQGIAYSWIYGLVTLFVLGVIFIVFDQIFVAHLNPIIINQVNNSQIPIDEASKNQIYGFINNYMTIWHILPIVLFLVVIFYMIIVTIRRERMEEQM